MFDDGETLARPPAVDHFQKWSLGLGVALLPVSLGIHGIYAGHIYLNRRLGLELHGTSATALSLAYIATGVFMHAHWFWGQYQRLVYLSQLVKIASLLVLVVSMAYVCKVLIA